MRLKLKATFRTRNTLSGFTVAQNVTLLLIMGLASKRAIEGYTGYAPERPQVSLHRRGNI